MSARLKYLLPRVLFTSALGAACLWYLRDAAAQSTHATNLVLLLPATLIAVLLCVAVIAEDVVQSRRLASAEDKAKVVGAKLDWRVPVLMILVGAYVTVTMTIGAIDVATFAFVAAALTLLGERRAWVVAAFSGGFSFAVVWGLEVTLSYDVPTLLL